MILDNINCSSDVKKLNIGEKKRLAGEIRDFLVQSVSKTGGHLSSNLGVVELTLALHSVFDLPQDKIVWDVGHQTYVHKILTGRKDMFSNLRKFEGLSGFPKRGESEFDAFDTGHSSTSISAALGMACARDLDGKSNSVVAVIGDGAMTGGLAFEALNNGGRSNCDHTVILNDNEMSIIRNVGGMAYYLNALRTKKTYYNFKSDVENALNKIPRFGGAMVSTIEKAKGTVKYLFLAGILFEELGYKYYGPIDGNNLEELTDILEKTKNVKGPLFIHIYTKKGRGYQYAEFEPDTYHGISTFDVKTGKSTGIAKRTYSDVFGDKLVEIADKNDKVVAVSAAMASGTGLVGFSKQFPKRFFDVGIAEQHAVTFAAGLAVSGYVPVVSIYSTFLQRAYDQILHDACVQNLHIVFAIDRAGIVGEDGETHQGIFDIAYLQSMPNMTILAPASELELEHMLEYAVNSHKGPIAVRYPRGGEWEIPTSVNEFNFGKADVVVHGDDVTIIAVGKTVGYAVEAANMLKEHDISAEVVNLRCIKPLDKAAIIKSCLKTKKVLTVEDGILCGGVGQAVACMLNDSSVNCKIVNAGVDDKFVQQGSVSILHNLLGIDAKGIVHSVIGKLFI